MAARVSFWLDSLLRSYARIFFADSRLLGAAILASTFVFPAHGFFGLLAVIIVNAAALAVGLERSGIRQGLYGFNGVLTGLGIGFFYNWNLQSLSILIAAAILVLFVRVLVDRFLGYYLGLPAMSIPFTLVTWLLLLASLEFGYLGVSTERLQLFKIQVEGLPGWIDCLLCNFGAVLFQINPLSGLIIVIGLLLYSPAALLLGVLGFLAGSGLHGFLGIDTTLVTSHFLGFNYILTALALGGIFAVPSPGSLLVAAAGVFCSVLILTGLLHILPAFLTPLAMPFNLAVLLVLYTLKSRSFPGMGISLVPIEKIATPEEHAAGYNCRFTFALPFNGSWQVSQGINGPHTHRDDWAFAYDFMSVDDRGAGYRGTGGQVEDYFSFGLPVLAPAPGLVAAVYDSIRDNPVGRSNREDNWGNYVIIGHSPDLYSCLAHLKKGSIVVEPGQRVEQGQIVGLCGNSGRSPYPHLHLQMQMHPFVGAPAIPFYFANLQLRRGAGQEYLHRSTLSEGQFVRNLPCSAGVEAFFPYRESGFGYFFACGREETWHWEGDAGEQWLETSPDFSRAYFSFNGCVLRFHRLEGSRKTGLSRLVSLAPEIPLLEEGKWQWTARTIPRIWFLRRISAMLFLFGLRPMVRLECSLDRGFTKLRLTVISTPCLQVGKHLLPLAGRREPLEVVFRRGEGVESLLQGGFMLRSQRTAHEADSRDR